MYIKNLCRVILIVLISKNLSMKCHAGVSEGPVVHTRVGSVQGQRAEDGDYSMFLGIPYGKVDDDNPFGPSVPYERFEQVYQANDDTAACPQVIAFSKSTIGSLDCLHLNIYVPDTASSYNPLPILVWIYGGHFQIGLAGRYLYGPKFFVRHDIIVVTVNYRLGPYGFMCLDIPDVPGNQGLKDQLRALRWIKENISLFGGDPSKITLLGESAGGVSVDLHLISTQEKLFNNVIMQSGTSLLPGFIVEPNNTHTIHLAKKLGFETYDINEALAFLRSVDTNSVLTAADHLDLEFMPCVEKDFYNVEKFIQDYSYNLDIPKVKDMAVLIGHNSDERLTDHINGDSEYFEHLNIFHDKIKESFNYSSSDLTDAVNNIRHFYIGDEEINEYEKYNIIDFDSDYSYVHPTQRSIQKYMNNNASNIFYYIFSYNGNRNFRKFSLNVAGDGASHADEIGYLFDVSTMRDTPSQEDQQIIDIMTTMWANFVKNSEPTPETSKLLPVNWKPVERNSLYYLVIDSQLVLKRRPFNKRMAFWDLFYKHNYQYQRGYRNKNN